MTLTALTGDQLFFSDDYFTTQRIILAVTACVPVHAMRGFRPVNWGKENAGESAAEC
jgi:hypothetical protein